MDIRKATAADDQDILKVLLAATTCESQWQYCFPYSRQYPEEQASRIKTALGKCLSLPNDWLVAVAEAPQDHGQHAKRIVSVAIWHTSTPEGVSHGRTNAWEDSWKQLVGPSAQTGKDCHPSHLAAFISATALGRESYLAKYGPQAHLHVLATHPKHQGQGIGKALCTWGLKWAAGKKMATSTLVSAKGYIFFSGMGFADVGCVTVKSEGDKEELMLKVMVYVGTERRGSSVRRFLSLD